MRVRYLIPAAVLACVLVAAGCAAGVTESGSGSPATKTATTTTTKTDKVSCAYVDANDAVRPVEKPNGEGVPNTGTVQFTVKLAAGELAGDVVLTMDRSKAPCTVNSFESLAAQGFYNNTVCHRSFAGAMFQCGDPSGTGRGGPGYSYADEITPDTTSVYPRGVVAMANAGADTNGSQFFLVYNELPLDGPKYTVFATIDEPSLGVLEALGALGQSEADPYAPAQPIQIVSVTKN
ncbi:MAG: peptidylprolyl isomerase [Propionibacteriaceae bacterium]|jgi:peptidyl-prolyl cis-trans isomerase B (cyclophilin B)|nr:peptidylprolyl isomerase [Propionibacteriaceae bacterium]